MSKVQVNRVNANIVEWFDNKGYGFARMHGGSERIFVHAKSLNKDRHGKSLSRLKKGDELELEVIKGLKGRPAAQNVRLLSKEDLAKQLPLHLFTAAILLLIVQLIVVLDQATFSLLATYSIMGLISLYLYRYDKRAAQYGWPRIREWQLLAVDFFGGIIGGLIGQARYRHKTSKITYQARTFITVAIHSMFLGLWGAGIIF